ncbi:MAG TPA: M48 family metalloprotease [Polyangiaceae bacterium LLY-WYZ-15_(1-7)]|nr:M48 family metalloprotease [Polyangiaceae bacterium LLY-WYZ-15_(1-7)]HJL07806.1 M48 family metalloprotease [Polyangiaceae bacterium LLY-WYZ-15_(1-7)]HJL33678.1 M48 family metalloprotease [Polyangiaceae bacterium LLY-WYZ-15_(1-7)]HJL37236.1 M48 family metalloprotease [Polyangiaceae bacterium LLY-WYZ-15_(1-7)]
MSVHAFWSQRLRNRLTSAALLVASAALLAFVGFLLGGRIGALWALGFAAVFVAFAPRASAEWLLKRSGARTVGAWEAPGLIREVRELALAAGIAPPRLLWIPSEMPNALATGEGDEATLAVSEGLLRHLPPRERRAVIAHEITHLRHGDARVLRVVATLEALTGSMSRFGVLVALLQLPLAMFGFVVLPWAAVLLLALAPLASAALRLAVSRSRELDADLGAVELTGDPRALASALRRLEALERRQLAWLPIALPTVPGWLRSHPATAERVARLEALAEEGEDDDDAPTPRRGRRPPVEPLVRPGNPRRHGRPVRVVDRPPGWFEVAG